MATALITGATSGIGEATATLFANNGINLIICGRREERLLKLKTKLEQQVNVKTLSFDVSDKEAVFSELGKINDPIDYLINNAGNAHGLSSIENGDVNDWDAMIDINVKGLLYVSKVVVPQMIEHKKGHIINIGSIAGKEVYANGNVYCASKHAVDAINKAMLIDLNKHGIKVGSVNPGLVQTEFSEVRFKGNIPKADLVYSGFDPLQANDIAESIYFMISRPAHVNIADLTIFPTAQGSATLVNKN